MSQPITYRIGARCSRCGEPADDRTPCLECNRPPYVEENVDGDEWAEGWRWDSSRDDGPESIDCDVCWSPAWCTCLADGGALGGVRMIHQGRVDAATNHRRK